MPVVQGILGRFSLF
ncbi:hypothetical protein FE839_16570 [Klebsiella indica]|uniref:Uncharacterized protein n=1 Tax=Klebsiella indica TaxID=2582917 RepID=A0A5R9LFM8_9ENTR|nr:hypothetical protein FE839_16570 [Klebsiella indica]